MSLISQLSSPKIKSAGSETDLGSFTPPTETYSAGSGIGKGAITNAEALISTIIGFLTVLGAIFFVINFVSGALS